VKHLRRLLIKGERKMPNIKDTIYVHAVQRNSWDVENDRANGIENPEEFRYELSLNETPWIYDAVCIWKEEIEIGFSQTDCKQRLVMKLQEEKKKVLADSQRKIEELEDKIRQLTALTYQV
jgi:hypothetical protein